jgi:CHAT domain-containing protein
MMLGQGAYSGGHVPRVVQVQVSRYARRVPRRGEPLEFLVALHVEGTATTWQRNAALAPAVEQQLLESIDGLRRWSAGLGLTRHTARGAVTTIGTILRDTFLGDDGSPILSALRPTAILWCVDETVIHLPWEMTFDPTGGPLIRTPLGRVVASRIEPAPGRDPTTEDPAVRILVVENPTEDLSASDRVAEIVHGLQAGGPDVSVVTLPRRKATRAGLADAVRGRDFDILHFTGHGLFDTRRPGDVALVLRDGSFDGTHVLGLEWSKPPFVVVNSSCESGRAAPGRRIVTPGRQANGLAAAFLSRGVEAYLGHYFLVGDEAAALFSQVFYSTLFERRNLGTAVLAARERLAQSFPADDVDLTALGATFFGDAGTAERYDTATAA